MRGRCREIEVAPVVLDDVGLRKRQHQVADRLVRHLRQRLGHHFLACQVAPLRRTGRRQQTPDLGQRVLRVRIDRVVRAACPQRVFVELQPFMHDAAEHHRAEPPIADRKRANPLGIGALSRRRNQRMVGCRLPVPETEGGGRLRRLPDQLRRGRGLSCARRRSEHD